MRTRRRDGTARAGDSDIGFGSRSGIIVTGSSGFVSAQLVGQREVSRGSHPAFSAAECSLPGKKHHNIGAVVHSQHRGKKLWSLQGLGRGEGAVWGEVRILELMGRRVQSW